MKKSTGYLLAIVPVMITLSIYVVFYERIVTNPSNAGFWMILALGMSIGVAFTRVAQLLKK
jgi:hypothetical protein